MSGSALLSTKAALVTLFRGAGVSGLQVSSGASFDPGVNYLLVGWNGGESAPVTVSRTVTDAGMARKQETVQIMCLLSFWCGSKTAQQVETDVVTAFNTLDAALVADHTLGGLALMAGITEYDYDPDIYETGDEAAMRIVVTVIAWK